MILDGQDELDRHEKELEGVARSLGLEQKSGHSLQVLLGALPEEAGPGKGDEIKKAHRDYEAAKDSLAVYREELSAAKLEWTKPFEPVKVHTVATATKGASSPQVTWELLWGLGKGLGLGLFLALMAHIFLKRSVNQADEPEVRESREADPADVW